MDDLTIFKPLERLGVHFLDFGGGVSSGPAATAVREVGVDGGRGEEMLLVVLAAGHVYVLLFENEASRALILTQKRMMHSRCRGE